VAGGQCELAEHTDVTGSKDSENLRTKRQIRTFKGILGRMEQEGSL